MIRTHVRRFVLRWRDILRDHDWELVAVLIASVGMVRGVVYALPTVLHGPTTRFIAGLYSGVLDPRVAGGLFVVVHLVILAGIYQARYRMIRAGLFHASALWGFHAYLSIWKNLLPGAVYQVAFSLACGLMFVRAGVEHPSSGARRVQPES